MGYTFTFRRSVLPGSAAHGLLLQRQTSGLPPFLFVGDVGLGGRAFSNEDLALVPLRVDVVEQPQCARLEESECGTVYRDLLRFDSSTGAANVIVDAYQGTQASLYVLGAPFTVLDLESSRTVPGCPGGFGSRVAYLAMPQ